MVGFLYIEIFRLSTRFILCKESLVTQMLDHYYFVTILGNPTSELFLLVMLKILQARPQQYVNLELPNVQAGFRKGIGTRDQIASILWIIEIKQESSSKTSIYALLTMPKRFTV